MIALSLVGLNAFFVAAEFSLVKVRKTRLVELSDDGSPKAKVALEVASKMDAYLSACQLGITLSSLGLGWLGEPAIARLLVPIFAGLDGWARIYTHTIALVIAFIIITFLHIVLGELVPKSLAVRKAEPTALSTAGPLRSFYRILFPAIWALNGLANSILRIWGFPPANENDLAHTEDELRMLVEASEKHGHLDEMEGMLLDNVFEFSDRVAEEVMIPRQDMVCLYVQDPLDKATRVAKEYGHTRYPLCDDDKDNVIGMVHIRDLINIKENTEIAELAQLKRDILVVPEGIPISHLVQKMRAARTHMAIVADEFGGTAGLATIEDLVEELVGEIYDEFDLEDPEIRKVSENEYEIKGRVLLDDVTEITKVAFEDEDVSTIGGYIFTRLGRKPKKGDELELGDYMLKVSEVNGPRILQVNMTKGRKEGGN